MREMRNACLLLLVHASKRDRQIGNQERARSDGGGGEGDAVQG
jgi:hypothetical protein